jgi:UDP-3-O-[3-hydroxymyristoyl] glucosamine N-acyltransferase
MYISDIAKALEARYEGDGGLQIDRLTHPAEADRGSDLALAMNKDAVAALAHGKAQAAVVAAKNPAPSGAFKALITVDDPRLALARLTALFDPGPAHEPGVHPTAIVAADAEIGDGVSIGPYAVVGARSRIGAGTIILPQATVGADVEIGACCLFHSGVRIGDRVRIGNGVIIHANAVIGADGFSYAPDLASPTAFVPGMVVTRVHSLGTVELADEVEIGAGTTIDRSTIETTRIGRATKIDNHVHIGHNVTVGESCMICGMVGISGSVRIGDRVRLGGGVGVADHVTIGDQAVVAAGSGVASNVAAGTLVSGFPAQPHQRSTEQFYYMTRQKRLHGKVDEISARLEAVERSVNSGDQTR